MFEKFFGKKDNQLEREVKGHLLERTDWDEHFILKMAELKRGGGGGDAKTESNSETEFNSEIVLNHNFSLGNIIIDGKVFPAIKKNGKVQIVNEDYSVEIAGGGIEGYFWDGKKWVLND